MLSVAPRVCVALAKCVMDGQGELGAFPQVDSPPFKFREDSGGRVLSTGVSILKGLCHVDSSQNVRSVGRFGMWNLLVGERRSSVWRRLLQDQTVLLCYVVCGSGVGVAGSGHRCSAAASRTKGCGGRSAALSERVPSRSEFQRADAKRRLARLFELVRCGSQAARQVWQLSERVTSPSEQTLFA